MSQLSINIKIENRNYPMTIKSEDEENLRLAGKLINDKIKQYRGHFNRSDSQDLLSMVAIEAMSENLRLKEMSNSENESTNDRLLKLDQKLSEYLSN